MRRLTLLLFLAAVSLVWSRASFGQQGASDAADDWNRPAAASYLDQRMDEWFDRGEKLRTGDPRIVFTSSKLVDESIAHPTLVPGSLRDGEEVIVAKRLKQFFLTEAAKPSTQA